MTISTGTPSTHALKAANAHPWRVWFVVGFLVMLLALYFALTTPYWLVSACILLEGAIILCGAYECRHSHYRHRSH